MSRNPQKIANLFIFTNVILRRKLHFLWCEYQNYGIYAFEQNGIT